MDWFNQVDETYRTDLRDLNELNFSRFDAKLEQRLAEADAKWERRFAEWDTKWERRFAPTVSCVHLVVPPLHVCGEGDRG